MKRVEIWDGWRGVAICFLLSGHFLHTDWIWEERLGVDIFFVLSGMLMSKILFEKRMKLGDFYVRRFSRIFPALMLFVFSAFAFATVAGLAYQSREIFANLVFIRTYWPSEPHIWDTLLPLGHLWSLNVEEHAYVIMSIMTLIFLRNRNAAYTLLGLGLLSILICAYYVFGTEINNDLARIRTESAISFVFLSAGYNLLKNQIEIKPPPYLPVLTFIVAILCYWEYMPDWTTFSVTPILLAFTVNHLLDSAPGFQWFLGLKAIRMMGLWSYSIYLWQQPFYIFGYALPGRHITGLALAILIGYLSFTFYENPVREWINRRWSRKYNPVK